MTLAAGDVTRIPVVLPHLRIEVSSDGQVTACLDDASYDVPPDWARLGRAAVPRILDHVASEQGSPIRVDISDDHTTFTDIVTPKDRDAEEPPTASPPIRTAGEVLGSGFAPDEQVAVALVVAHLSADGHGVARLRLPPALLANRSGLVVLLGTTSGTVALSGGSP